MRSVKFVGREEKAANPYQLREVRFPDGERLPLLVCRVSGLPIELATYWVTSDLRGLNKQATTLRHDLENLMVAFLWADARGLDLPDAIKAPAFLTLSQMNDLDGFCRRPVSALVAEVQEKRAPSARSRGKPLARNQVRSRMYSIHRFLMHVSADHLSRLTPNTPEHATYRDARAEGLERWGARYKALDASRSTSAREGLSAAEAERLKEVIRPDSPDNPWLPEVRRRNGLVVLLLWATGIRRGELLALEASDFTPKPNGAKLRILRRPDNPRDRRARQPAVKTLGRDITVHDGLAALLQEYILEDRRKLPGARKHPFLFVSSADGAPLSLSGVNKLFRALQAVDGLPGDLSPHVLRHTWNDDFSAQSDLANPHRTDVERIQEERNRAYLMGWSMKSTMPRLYSRRWIRETANQHLLKQQAAIEIAPAKDGEGEHV